MQLYKWQPGGFDGLGVLGDEDAGSIVDWMERLGSEQRLDKDWEVRQ